MYASIPFEVMPLNSIKIMHVRKSTLSRSFLWFLSLIKIRFTGTHFTMPSTKISKSVDNPLIDLISPVLESSCWERNRRAEISANVQPPTKTTRVTLGRSSSLPSFRRRRFGAEGFWVYKGGKQGTLYRVAHQVSHYICWHQVEKYVLV